MQRKVRRHFVCRFDKFLANPRQYSLGLLGIKILVLSFLHSELAQVVMLGRSQPVAFEDMRDSV